jgi:hypothetical protein
MTKRKAATATDSSARKPNHPPGIAKSDIQEGAARMRPEFDSLHKEVQIAEYAQSHGQNRKKVPRKELVLRTKRRKLLEKEDAEALAVRAPSEDHDEVDSQDAHSKSETKNYTKSRRLRGSKAAIQDHVIQASMVFPHQQKQKDKNRTTTQKHRQDQNQQQQQQQILQQQQEKPMDEKTVRLTSQLLPPALKERLVEFKEVIFFAEQEKGEGDKSCDAEEENNLELCIDNDDQEYIQTSGDDSEENDGSDVDDDDELVEDDNQAPEGSESEGNSNGRAAVTKLARTLKSTALPRTMAKAPSRTKKERLMYKMRGFQSLKMAQRHGDALGAHARGNPREAIEKLTQVAKDAPSAPQVYSSLGMVYEDMLQESRKRQRNGASFTSPPAPTFVTAAPKPSLHTTKNSKLGEETDFFKLEEIDVNLAQQLLLAQKAYGSYHVAAILCKKDFNLWVRAADFASDIADLHSNVMALPNISTRTRKHYGSERRRWQSEALRDYMVADNLKPPGIDIPAKLAAMHMELGNLSEALTILTDLKNRSDTASGRNSVGTGNDDGDAIVRRSEFESSYKAWLLYADLMLRIGHECTQWNRGIQTNDNYMFRRWLRKLSRVFDWQERRLQALSLALEAAAGSTSAKQFMIWMRQRALAKVSGPERPNGGDCDQQMVVQKAERWHINTGIDLTSEPHQETRIGHSGSPNFQSESTANNGAAPSRNAEPDDVDRVASTDATPGKKVSFHPGRVVHYKNCSISETSPSAEGFDEGIKETSKLKVSGPYAGSKEADEGNGSTPIHVPKVDGGSLPSSATREYNDPPASHVKGQAPQFEKEKNLLLAKNSAELEAFDKTTRDLDLQPESLEDKDRKDAKLSLLKRHETAIAAMMSEYQDQDAKSPLETRDTGLLETSDTYDEVIGIDQEPLPMSASCRSVCMVASELIKHLYGLELYEGGRLVGEAVSLYLKERAAWQDKRVSARKEKDEWHKKAEMSILFASEPYNEVSERAAYLSQTHAKISDFFLTLSCVGA